MEHTIKSISKAEANLTWFVLGKSAHLTLPQETTKIQVTLTSSLGITYLETTKFDSKGHYSPWKTAYQMLRHPAIDRDDTDLNQNQFTLQNSGRTINHYQENFGQNTNFAGQFEHPPMGQNAIDLSVRAYPLSAIPIPTARLKGNNVNHPIDLTMLPKCIPVSMPQVPNSLTVIAGAQSLPQYPYITEAPIGSIKTEQDPSPPPALYEEEVVTTIRSPAAVHDRAGVPKVMRLHSGLKSLGKRLYERGPSPESPVEVKNNINLEMQPQDTPQQPRRRSPNPPMYIKDFQPKELPKPAVNPGQQETDFQ